MSSMTEPLAILATLPESINKSFLLIQPVIETRWYLWDIFKWKNKRNTVLWGFCLNLVILIPESIFILISLLLLVHSKNLWYGRNPQARIAETRHHTFSVLQLLQVSKRLNDTFNSAMEEIYSVILYLDSSFNIADFLSFSALFFCLFLVLDVKIVMFLACNTLLLWNCPYCNQYSGRFADLVKDVSKNVRIWFCFNRGNFDIPLGKNSSSSIKLFINRDSYWQMDLVVYENQRWWLGLDWQADMLSQDPPSWTYSSGEAFDPLDVKVPHGWTLSAGEWTVCSDWEYSDSFSGSFKHQQGYKSVVRRRKWCKKIQTDFFSMKYEHLKTQFK